MNKSDKKLFDIIDQALTSSVEGSSTLMMLYEEAEFLLLRIASLEKKNTELTKEAQLLRDELSKLRDVEKAASAFLDAVSSKKHEKVSTGIRNLHTAIKKKPGDPNDTLPPASMNKIKEE